VTTDELSERLATHPAADGIRLVVLHGSRARGDARQASDWDVAVVGEAGAVDLAELAAAIAEIVGTDAVDVVDLARASALLRFRAARDGLALVDRTGQAFLEFRLAAVTFWCDAGPVIRAAGDDVLAAL
jgi:predicted nucleotidyltransferase